MMIVAGILLPFGRPSSSPAAEQKLNVLFIAVDDLRPQLGCYGDPLVKTPNIDALAATGTIFRRAYCQQAVCSPSRTSLLTGRRPDTTKIYELQTHFRVHLPDVVTLPQHFKNAGYRAQSFGKIYHGGLDDPQSWSAPAWFPDGPGYGKPETLAALTEKRLQMKAEGKSENRKVLRKDPKTGTVLKRAIPKHRVRGPAWEAPDVPDNELPDGKTADRAIQVMRESKDEPFFLAVGFVKPHLPFVAPKKYFDLYPPEKIKLAKNPHPPKDMPDIASTNWGELRNYEGMPPKGPVSDEDARRLIRAYYAAVSYIDAQVGRLMNELDRLDLRNNTVVVLWGDHGWQLGEHGFWCKHTNFELAARAPLIVAGTTQKQKGAQSNALVEFVDIYPTLCELAGLPLPSGLEGTSLVPLLDDPDRPWKPAAFSQYPRGKIMGYSMRTDRYRYTEWRPQDGPPEHVELYDHQTDPDENVNVAHLEKNKNIVKKLSDMLQQGWQAATPQDRTSDSR